MRNKETLIHDFENIKILQQFLYMSSEHRITIKNAIGIELELRMDENLHYYCRNTKFPDSPETCWSDNMNNETFLAIIDQLQENKAEDFPEFYESRWEEITVMCKMTIAANRGRKNAG